MTLLATAGCGFRMVGTGGLAPSLSKVYIDYSAAYTVVKPHLLSALRRDLQARGAAVVDDAKQASAVLKIYSVGGSQRVAAVGPSGYTEEYELIEHVRFDLTRNGKTVVAPTTLSRSQDYAYTATAILATDQERQRLQRQLQEDLAQAVLRHIDIVLASGRALPHNSPSNAKS